MGEYRAHKTAATANLTASKQQLADLIKINKRNHIVQVLSLDPPAFACIDVAIALFACYKFSKITYILSSNLNAKLPNGSSIHILRLWYSNISKERKLELQWP